MIVIGLDEYGHFEDVRGDQCMLIGGIAYRCSGPEEADRELGRLRALFEKVCQEQDAVCPQDLHYNWADGHVVNAKKAEAVKDALSKALPEYFRNRKTDEGSYSVYCMLGDRRVLHPEETGSFRDDVAAVRYEHMVYRTVENLIFFNPFFRNEDSYRLELATRVAGISNPQMREEMNALGYAYRRDENGGFDTSKAVITDEASFRTCLETAILNHDRTDLKIDLKVQSIRYRGDQYVKNQGFLYLSDTICSMLEKAIEGCRTIESALPKIVAACERLTPAGPGLIWAYDPMDILWRKTWKQVCDQRWFEALRLAADGFRGNGVIARTYRKVWVEKMKDALSRESNDDALREAVDRLSAYLDDMQGRNLKTGMAIAKQLEKHVHAIRDERTRGETEYGYWKAMFGIYNHLGNARQAQKAYSLCMARAKYVPIEEYLGLQLMYIVSLCDQLQFEEAEAHCETILSYQRILYDIRREVFPDQAALPLSFARTLSQYGQCLAFQGKNTQAVEQFREALGIFEPHSRDWYVTSTYLMHALIENRDTEGYEEWAEQFYGAKGVREQLRRAEEGQCGKSSYAIYPLIKSVWYLYRDSLPVKTMTWLLRRIGEIAARAEEYGEGGHPWENIMKYCAMLQAYRFEKDGSHAQSETFLNLGISFVASIEDSVLEKILAQNTAQYHRVIENLFEEDGDSIRFIYN